jgi:hypothetical protein
MSVSISGAESKTRQQYWREADARVWVDAWRQSGQTQAEFARTHGIHVERLARWARRLGESSQESMAFHPMRVRSSSVYTEREECIEPALGDGRSIRLPSGFDAADLRRVLDVLAARACC